ncbi:MAG TPA: zf-HC2 domain-containing protein, partial [Longimicrobiales bacterium]|nr:zf-HC2 domain-containing protein [Longimicrobiales bacterium]
MNPGKAGRSREVECAEFLARHSEYLDGLLTPVAAARLSAHSSVCASCARYDRIVRKGIDLVRDLPDAQPSDDFEMRLQHRIFHMEDARALQPRAAGAAAALAVAAAMALLAWSPLLVTSQREMAAAPP